MELKQALFDVTNNNFPCTLNNNYLLNASSSKKTFTCELCSISVTSQRVLQRHLEGRKHKLRNERNGKSFVCELCEVTANSEKQLESHLLSSRHKAKLEHKDNNGKLICSKGFWVLILGVAAIFISTYLVFKNSY